MVGINKNNDIHFYSFFSFFLWYITSISWNSHLLINDLPTVNLPCSTELRVISSSLRASTVTLGKGSRLLVTWAVRLCIVHCIWQKVKKMVWDSGQHNVLLFVNWCLKLIEITFQKLHPALTSISLSLMKWNEWRKIRRNYDQHVLSQNQPQKKNTHAPP